MEPSVKKKAKFVIPFLDVNATFADFVGKEPADEEDEMEPIPMAIQMPEDEEEAPATSSKGGEAALAIVVVGQDAS